MSASLQGNVYIDDITRIQMDSNQFRYLTYSLTTIIGSTKAQSKVLTRSHKKSEVYREQSANVSWLAANLFKHHFAVRISVIWVKGCDKL